MKKYLKTLDKNNIVCYNANKWKGGLLYPYVGRISI